MNSWNLSLAVMESIGTILALVGLIRIYSGTKARYRSAVAQLDRALELEDLEQQEIASARDTGSDIRSIIASYRELHLANGLPRPAGYGESHQPGHEAVSVLRVLGDGAKADLFIAIVGVSLSGAAGILGNLVA